MILLFSLLVPLVKAVSTPVNESLADVQTHAIVSFHQAHGVTVQGGNSFQKQDESKKSSVFTVERKHFKGLALPSHQWATGLWPKGVVPFEILPGFNVRQRQDIWYAMYAFHKHTCIRFRKRTPADMYYVSIYTDHRGGCYSYVGRQILPQFRTREGKIRTLVHLHSSCLNLPAAIHELMHAIGFFHEHQRMDRDWRVSYSPHNPVPLYEQNIRKTYNRNEAYYMGRYDPESVMHYSLANFKPYPRRYFSPSDIYNINTLYRCPQARRR